MSSGRPWRLRWVRLALPRHDARTCCWYHSGDWHRVNRLALEALSRAQREGVKAKDMARYADKYAAAAGASEWERDALFSMYRSSDAVQPSGSRYLSRSYINGQHRVQAMLDAGVRRTVVLRLTWPDSPAD
ncbi:hypothetical protein [Streptomyces prunicolor]